MSASSSSSAVAPAIGSAPLKQRVVVLGGGLAGLLALAQIHSLRVNGDLLDSQGSLGGHAVQFSQVDLSAENAAFLAQFSINPASLTAATVYQVIRDGLIAHLKTQAVKEVRILYETEATSVLTSAADGAKRALGVRFKRHVNSVDGKSKQTEANIFGDALVCALTLEPLLALFGGLNAKVEGQQLMLDGQPLDAFFLAKTHSGAQVSLNAFIDAARLAGKKGCEMVPLNVAPNGIRQPLPFVDKNGLFHGVALSPTTWIPLVLENRMQLNKFNHLFRFVFADKNQQAGLFCGQYISIRAMVEGKEVIRYYSPVSRNSDYGHIDLMIKIEENTENKPMEKFLSEIRPGQTVDFKGPMGGFEYHRNMYREIGMIAGGTGITPMVQIIRSISNHPEDDTHAKLLYGNYNEEDILCRDELSYYTLTRSNIDVYISLNNPPGKWAMGVGFVDESMIRKALPAPAHDIIILLCGPPPMIKALITTLKTMGYTDQMIFSFI